MTNKNISHARILQEIRNINKEKLPYLKAQPLEDDIYTWHFTIQGPEGTDFHEGLYHGQILLPFQYPFKPPDIVFNNKNGRFEVDTKICLTITQYHPDEWNSAWTIRTMLEAVISLFNEKVVGVGYVESSSQVRKYLAKTSQSYVCQKCGMLKEILKPRQPFTSTKEIEKEEKIDQYMEEVAKMEYRKLSSKREQRKIIIEPKPQKKQKKKKKTYKNNGIDYLMSTMQRGTNEYAMVMGSIRYITQ